MANGRDRTAASDNGLCGVQCAVPWFNWCVLNCCTIRQMLSLLIGQAAHMTHFIIIPLICLCFVGCTKAPSMNSESTLSDTTRRSIAAELAWLQQSGQTVIIEEPASKKFVQFGWKTLMIDLPAQTLSEEEMGRAERVMAGFGVPKRTYEIGTPGDKVPQTTFQKHLGTNVDLAIRAVEVVFREIYLFPQDVRLQFTRVE